MNGNPGSKGPEEWDIALHGDDLEREKVDFIRAFLPAYEEIWRRYIGRQPNLKAASMEGLITTESNTEREKRLRYSQHQYSILTSIDGMQRLLDVAIGITADTQIREIRDSLILFHCYLGRVHDAIDRAGNEIGLKDLMPKMKWQTPLNDLYSDRCVVVHGPHLPLLFNGHEVMIGDPKRFDDHKGLWGETTEYNSLAEYYETQLNSVINLAQSTLSDFLTYVKESLKFQKLAISLPRDPGLERAGSSDVDGRHYTEGIRGGSY